MVGPVREELSKDETFTLSTAKSVTSRIRKDRISTMETLADSELDISPDMVPKLSGDLTSENVHDIDRVLRAEFGEEWFKNRKSFSTAIMNNHSLMSSICTVFYLKSTAMLDLVEKGISTTCPETSRSGIIVDGPLMEEFLNSADLVRTEAWKHASSFYNKARERMQRNNRAKRHRRKVKSDKLSEGASENDRSGDLHKAKAESGSESEGSRSSSDRSKHSDQSKSRDVVRDSSKLEPFISVRQCVMNLLEAVEFLNSNASQKDKYKRLTELFDEHSAQLKRRMGTCVDREEAQICMSVAILTFIHSILPDHFADALVSRLTIVTKEFSNRGVIGAEPPRSFDARLRSRIELMLARQFEIVKAVVIRWIANESDSDLKLTKSEAKIIQGLAVELAAILKDLEECLSNGNLNRLEVTWILTSFCHFCVRTSVLLWETPKSSSFKRAGQVVTDVSGLYFINSQLHILLCCRMARESKFERFEQQYTYKAKDSC